MDQSSNRRVDPFTKPGANVSKQPTEDAKKNSPMRKEQPVSSPRQGQVPIPHNSTPAPQYQQMSPRQGQTATPHNSPSPQYQQVSPRQGQNLTPQYSTTIPQSFVAHASSPSAGSNASIVKPDENFSTVGLEFSSERNFSRVFARGEFNDWSENGQVELARGQDGKWTGSLRAKHGKMQIKFWAVEPGSGYSILISPHLPRVASPCGRFENNLVSF